MKTEHIVEKEDMKVKIIIEFFTRSINDKAVYRIADIQYLPKRKRKWLSVFDGIEYRYRRTDKEEKVKLLQEEYYKYVTEQDIKEALDKAYESLKPVFSLELFQK